MSNIQMLLCLHNGGDHCNVTLKGMPCRQYERDTWKGWDLKSLHWLLVSSRIEFKILFLVFGTLNGSAPEYLSDMLLMYDPSWSLKFPGTGPFFVPWLRTGTYEKLSFSVCGPRLWNNLLEELRTSQSVNTFKINLKTSLINSAFS